MENSEETYIKSELTDTNGQLANNQLNIEDCIITVRGQQVMLDRNLARLYGVETKALNQAVKRNIERFPEDFMFQLTDEESIIYDKEQRSRSHIVTLNKGRGSNIKYAPYAFTENGIAMLSGVLRSPTAIAVNIQIMRAFNAMRRFMMSNAQLFQRIDSLEQNQLRINETVERHERQFDVVLQNMDSRKIAPPTEKIFYDGLIFDAHTFVCDLIRDAKSRIILIDNYIDDTVLKRLDKREDGVEATIYTRFISKSLQNDIKIHNGQYPPIEVKTAVNFHDRFLIIDDDIYHMGASIKDLGKKVFAFTKMNTPAQELLSKL